MSDEAEYQAYCFQAEAEAAAEVRANDPVCRRFRCICFVSKSKGRRRRRWKEVELVHDRYRGTYTSYDRYPFDAVASEVLPYIDRTEVTRVLMDRVRQVA
jgi:hypothetical protein